jgi:hypothetical protein
VPGLAATTAAGLANRFSDGQWAAVETGLGDVAAAALPVLPAGRAAALCESVTIDLDTTGVEVYGRHKRGVAFNHQGQRVGRPARRARTAVAPSGAGSVRATVFVPGSTASSCRRLPEESSHTHVEPDGGTASAVAALPSSGVVLGFTCPWMYLVRPGPWRLAASLSVNESPPTSPSR